jgi:dUTPase
MSNTATAQNLTLTNGTNIADFAFAGEICLVAINDESGDCSAVEAESAIAQLKASGWTVSWSYPEASAA